MVLKFSAGALDLLSLFIPSEFAGALIQFVLM